jgi:sugar transferase (PEP-CTERM system associated)
MKSAVISDTISALDLQGRNSISAGPALVGEESFHQMLDLEKSRARRSQKPFFMMLVNAGALINGGNPLTTFQPISSALHSATRDTDIKGWYQEGRILGVLLTELGGATPDRAKARIFEKVHESLGGVLDPERLSLIEISFQLFPETDGRIEPCSDPLDLSTCKSADEPTREKTIHQQLLALVLHKSFSLFVGDLLIITLAHLVSLFIRLGPEISPVRDYTGAFLFSVITIPTALFIFDLYNVWRRFRKRDVILHTTAAVSLALAASMVFYYLFPQYHFGRGALAIQAVTLLSLLTLWRLSFWDLFKLEKQKIGALILGAGRSGQAVYKILSSPYSPYEVLGFLDDDPAKQGQTVGSGRVLGTLTQLSEIASQVGAKTAVVAVSRDRPQWAHRKTLEARLQGIEIMELPTVYEQFEGRVPVEHIEHQWLLFSEGFSLLHRKFIPKIKRLIDLMVSGLLLLMMLPIMVVVALAIYIESPGPIFYSQERVGKDRKVFRVRKFRSMKLDAEAAGAVWAQKRDPRVTRVGAWIRLCRLDELPQILNVVRGDMSLVGPRPERPEFVIDLEKQIPYYNIRHTVQPGVTGWAQIKYPYGASVEDSKNKLEYDIYYIKNMSIRLDLKILLRTVGVVLLGEGAR